MLAVVGCGGAGSRFARYIGEEVNVRSIKINDGNGDINVNRKNVEAYADVSPKIISQAFPWALKLSFPYIFVVGGLGGVVGTSVAKIIGKVRKNKSRLVGIFTLPFSSENAVRRRRALQAIQDIEKYYDIYFILDNDGLVNHYSHVPINVAMSIPAEVMKHIVLDFKRVLIKNFLNMEIRGRVGVGIGIGTGKERIRVAIEDALDSPWMSDGKKVMIFSGNIEIEDVEPVAKYYAPSFLDVYRTTEYGERVKVTIISESSEKKL